MRPLHPQPLTTLTPVQRLWSWLGKCPLVLGLGQGRGSLQTYLLTLLDVVVLPDVGAADEHDFELLLMPAVEEKGKVLNQLTGEDRMGLQGAWHTGER